MGWIKMVGVIYCFRCGRVVDEGDGMCDECLEELGTDWGYPLKRGSLKGKELKVEER